MPRATFHIKQYKQVKLAAILSFAVILLSGVYFLQPFSSDNSYAADHQDKADGSYNGTTYSLTTTVSDLNLELKNVTPAGKAVYGKQTVNVTTTAPGGYQLYMQTSGNLAGTKDGTATSDSITALSANNSALDTNSWGYVTAANLSSASTTLDEDMNKAATQEVWNTPPSTLTQIDATSSAATSGRDTDIYYGIKADNTLSGDNYSGTITYTTIANDAASDTLLSVSPASGTAGTATQLTIITSLMTTEDSLSASDISATVGGYTCGSISISSRAPLTFTCNTSTSLKTTGAQTITVKVNKYNKTYTKSSAYTTTTPTMDAVTYMQDVTQDMCKNATTYTTSNKKTYTLKDSRDQSTYQIRKLADDHCWMVQSLRLGKTTTMTLTPSDSDVTTSYTLPASINSGFNSKNIAQIHITDNSWISAYGNYYNWPAAAAGGATSTSICPKGWKLPLNTTATYSWYYLYNAGYNGNIYNFQKATNTDSTYWSGIYYNSSTAFAGSVGAWWSRAAYNSNSAYLLYFNDDGNSDFLGYGDKDGGHAIRCVFVGS